MNDAKIEAMKATPPLLVAASDPQWTVAVATVLYIVLQAAYLIWKWRREAGK